MYHEALKQSLLEKTLTDVFV